MITILFWIVLGGFAWLVLGTLNEPDWLDDQPAEVLAPAEITRRAERMWLA